MFSISNHDLHPPQGGGDALNGAGESHKPPHHEGGINRIWMPPPHDGGEGIPPSKISLYLWEGGESPPLATEIKLFISNDLAELQHIQSNSIDHSASCFTLLHGGGQISLYDCVVARRRRKI